MLQAVLNKLRRVKSADPDATPVKSARDAADIYEVMLGRTPSADQIAAFEPPIGGGLTREFLLLSLFRSDEFQSQTADRKAAAIAECQRRFGVALSDLDLISWFHSIDLPGATTRGLKPLSALKQEANAIFRYGVAGKSVLDIGAWDGFFSFEAERRGAASVLSTDHFCWSGPGWGTKAGYDYAHAALKSKATSIDVDLPDLDPAKLGRHNIVLFLGVLYHLKDPVRGLELAASVCDDLLVIETATALNNLNEPAARYYPGSELNGDDTNFWAPNVACLEGMLSDIGFKRVETTLHPLWRKNASGAQRHITHAWKNA